MFYKKVTPSAPLQPFVECFYVWEHSQVLTSPMHIESPPNGYSAMVFIYGDRYTVSGELQKEEKVPESFLAGQFTSNYHLHLQGTIGMAGIVFKPSAVATLFRVPMPECTNCRIPLDALLGPTAPELAEKLAEAGDFRQKVAVLEGFLLDHIRRQPFTIDLGDHAADIILERKGIVSVQDLADELGVNRRQLERKFMSKVGLSPKYYARVKRISYVCSLLVGEKNLDWQDAIFQGGYYDQSHFIKDFQEFVRQNPSLYYKGHNELINFLKK